MSLVTKEEIRSLSHLARLQLKEDEVESLQQDLTGILEHMKLLAEVDTAGVPAMTHVGSKVQPLRPDQVAESLDRERVLAQSQRTEDDCFAVPSILPGGEGQ